MRSKKRVWYLFLCALLFSAPVFGVSGQSIYQVKASWKTDTGKTVELGSWKGRKVVLSMIYTSCQGACPLIVKKLHAVQAQLDKQGVAADFVLVTFDTQTDSAKKLSHFRKHSRAERPNWSFLVGSEKDTRVLSMLLGIKYAKNPKTGEITHDNKVTLLNEAGEVVRTLEGLDSKVTDLF